MLLMVFQQDVESIGFMMMTFCQDESVLLKARRQDKWMAG
jgi:hypothetical protein